MFNVGAGEMALIAVAALLILGPKRLPELARGLGKFMREFRRQTDEVRGVVEREFYRMDQDIISDPPPAILPPPGIVANNAPPAEPEVALPEVAEITHSQAMMPPSASAPQPSAEVAPEGANPEKPA